jgi:DNA polymerase-3 subunit gamma/tau
MFGLTAQGQLLELSRAVLAGEVENALRQLNDLANHGKDLGRLLSDLLNHFRNLLIFQVSRGDLQMLEVSEAEAAALAGQTKMAGADGLTRILEVLADAEMRLRDAASKKILVEVALLKAIEARSALSLDSVLRQLQDLRDGMGGEIAAMETPLPARAAASSAEPKSAAPHSPKPPGGAVPGERAASTAGPAPIREQPPSATSPAPPGDLAELWAKILEAVGRASPFTRSYLLEAHPVSFHNNVFTIGFDPEFEDHIGLVDNARNHTLLQTKLLELGHPNVQFKFVKAEAPANRAATPAELVPPPASPPAAKAPRQAAAPIPAAATPQLLKGKLASVPVNQDDFKNDPLIQKALEIFKGQIVEVRA